MASLKLGPLPRLGTVKVTLAMPESLKEELDLYAAEYSRLYGPVEPSALIPHMLEAFLRSDRGWRSKKTGAKRQSNGTPKPLSEKRGEHSPHAAD